MREGAWLHWSLGRSFYTLLRYWHLLSLDAPTVAALWCWAFGRAARLELAVRLPTALALGTWLFYVADRLLDARLAPAADLQERHRFHHRHMRGFILASLPVAALLCMLIARMPASLLDAYLLLGLLSLAYLGVVHLPRGRALHYFPTELAVALLFAAAAALPAWDEARRRAAGMPRHHPLLLLCPLFACLCWLNCQAIEDWERRHGGPRVVLLAVLVAVASVASIPSLHMSTSRELALCAAISATLFLLLQRSPLNPAARRIAADLALLTPLLLSLMAWR